MITRARVRRDSQSARSGRWDKLRTGLDRILTERGAELAEVAGGSSGFAVAVAPTRAILAVRRRGRVGARAVGSEEARGGVEDPAV